MKLNLLCLSLLIIYNTITITINGSNDAKLIRINSLSTARSIKRGRGEYAKNRRSKAQSTVLIKPNGEWTLIEPEDAYKFVAYRSVSKRRQGSRNSYNR
jgi:hypothetical protein